MYAHTFIFIHIFIYELAPAGCLVLSAFLNLGKHLGFHLPSLHYFLLRKIYYLHFVLAALSLSPSLPSNTYTHVYTHIYIYASTYHLYVYVYMHLLALLAALQGASFDLQKEEHLSFIKH